MSSPPSIHDPTSPVCIHPSSSRQSLVWTSSLKYPWERDEVWAVEEPAEGILDTERGIKPHEPIVSLFPGVPVLYERTWKTPGPRTQTSPLSQTKGESNVKGKDQLQVVAESQPRLRPSPHHAQPALSDLGKGLSVDLYPISGMSTSLTSQLGSTAPT